MAVSDKARAVLERLDDALGLLDETILPVQSQSSEVADTLPSLLEMCENLLVEDRAPSTLRVLHHFACTGGTIISRAIAACPNVQLLSEIDPLSTLHIVPGKPPFQPTDLIEALRHSHRPVPETVLSDMFLSSLEVLHSYCQSQGQRLVLRDHAHSRYCTQRDPATRPGLNALLTQRFETLSVVSVRDPLDSFMSIAQHGWHTHMSEPTLEEYSSRYLQFLDDHHGLPIHRYENFTHDPEQALTHLCEDLSLRYSKDALMLLTQVQLTGDSGRKGNQIAPRPRRAVPDWIAEEASQSASYKRLCDRLGYPSI